MGVQVPLPTPLLLQNPVLARLRLCCGASRHGYESVEQHILERVVTINEPGQVTLDARISLAGYAGQRADGTALG